ncbi:hypothetical protein [Flavivirga rizhaonensis]|uniref:PKD domain-containing protein n=1 Tax=Flavivirga rizhaonensis TaxID=2559571 RepID=A0A4S1DTB0_9FLAO|nr:hypothetical protein [Flavivirga rizhaonensis]TGV01023.1 hypothetical protein EM932_17300 [Flavivirga rizhaonensis]
MKTIIKTLGLKTMILCLYFVCTGSLTSQNQTIETNKTNKSTIAEKSSVTYSLQSNLDSVSQGQSIIFVVFNDENGGPAEFTNYDWTVYDYDTGSPLEYYYDQTSPYFSIKFDTPGTFLVTAEYGNGSGNVDKTVTITP